MSNLLQFFLRFGGHFMFFLLEGVCFFIIIRYNDYQNRIFISSANTVVGYTADRAAEFWQYFSLKGEIKILKKENAGLRSQLSNAFDSDKIERDTVETEDHIQRYSFISADIISKAIIGNNNNITINRGAKHGVKMHMGVISDQGVVGIVTGVSKHYARVMTIFHRQAAISGSIKRNNYFGSLVWKDTDYNHLTLEAIPKYVSVQVGDTIQTSGYSDMFPPDIIIGTVESFSREKGDNNYLIKVKVQQDLFSLKHVYVVDNLFRNELEVLKQADNEE